MRKVLLVFLLWFALAATPAFAWNNCGHMLVAEIAYQELQRDHPELLARIIALLKKHPRIDDLEAEIVRHHIHPEAHDHYLFLLAATWPDLIKQTGRKAGERARFDPEDHREWHFIDLPYNLDGNGAAGPALDESLWKPGLKAEPHNCEQALDKAEAELSDTHRSEAERAKALSWLLHLVGDIHQPLHCATLYSTSFPSAAPFAKGDKGGNIFFLDEQPERSRQRKELHAYWDDVLGKSMSLAHINQYARHLIAVHSRKSLKKQIAEMSARDWAHESHELAVERCYLNGKLMPYHEPGAEYFYEAQSTAETQAALAGYRLADTLAKLSPP